MLISHELDGTPLILYYCHGTLKFALTYKFGSKTAFNVTHMVGQMKNVPLCIAMTEDITVPGIAVISLENHSLLTCSYVNQIACPTNLIRACTKSLDGFIARIFAWNLLHSTWKQKHYMRTG